MGQSPQSHLELGRTTKEHVKQGGIVWFCLFAKANATALNMVLGNLFRLFYLDRITYIPSGVSHRYGSNSQLSQIPCETPWRIL